MFRPAETALLSLTGLHCRHCLHFTLAKLLASAAAAGYCSRRQSKHTENPSAHRLQARADSTRRLKHSRLAADPVGVAGSQRGFGGPQSRAHELT